MPLKRAIFLVLAMRISSVTVSAADSDFQSKRLDNWHQWRGPLGTCSAPRGDPPLRFGEKENLRWKVEIPGEGHSSPIVWEDRVYVLSAQKLDRIAENPPVPDPKQRTKPSGNYYRFLVTALDRKTGEVRWQRTACEAVPHEGRQETNTYASGSPTTDGTRLYASFNSFGIYCYRLDGELEWKKDLGDMKTRLGWGEGASPTVHGDALVVNWDQEQDSYITALDTRTGEPRWKVERDELSTWTTPLVVEHGDTTQVIVNGTKRARSYDLKTGKVLWQCGGQTGNPVPSPVVDDGVAVIMSGYRGAAAFAIPLDARGDLTGSDKIRWRLDRGTPYVPSPLLYQGRIYFTQGNNAILTSVDFQTGKPVIEASRLEALKQLYASPVGAAGRIYLMDRGGATLVIRHGDKLEVLATGQLEEGVCATPAIAGRQLFVRGSRHLYCFEEGATGGKAEAASPSGK